MQGSVASFHFRNELSLSEEGDLLGEGGQAAILAQADGQVGRSAGRQTSVARSGSAVARGGGGGDLGGGVRVRRAPLSNLRTTMPLSYAQDVWIFILILNHWEFCTFRKRIMLSY